MSRRAISILALVLALAGLLAACAPSAPAGSGSTPGGSADAQKGASSVQGTPAAKPASGTAAKTTLVMAQGGDVLGLDPGIDVDAITMNGYINVFDALLKRDAKMVVQPYLATSYKAIDDVTWEVKLRQGVKFHNGEELNAEVAKFSIERIFKPELKSVTRSWLSAIKGVQVVDASTIRIITNAPTPTMPQLMAMLYMVPPKYIQEKGDAYFRSHPVGTGAFKFVEWKKDDRVILEANEDYWAGKPAFKQLIIRSIPDDASRVAALRAGEVDIVQNLPLSQVKSLEAANNVKVVKGDTGRIKMMQLAVNESAPQLKDARVRQAIAHAIDQSAIVKLMEGYASAIDTIISPFVFGFDPNVKMYPYDPNKAKQLLKEAKAEGFKFVLNVDPGRFPLDKDVAELIAAQLRAVGINAETKITEGSKWITGWREHTLGGEAFLLNLLSQTWDADGMLYLRFKPGQPMSYYSSPKIDELVTKGQTTIDPEQRKKIYSELLQILKEDMPIVPLVANVSIYGVSKQVQWDPRPDELMFLYEGKPAAQ